MTVVIKMPPEADRSQFRMAVIRANTKKDLFDVAATLLEEHLREFRRR